MHPRQRPARTSGWFAVCCFLFGLFIYGQVFAEGYPLHFATLDKTVTAYSPLDIPSDAHWRPTETLPIQLDAEGWLRITIAPLVSAQPLYLITPRRATGRLNLWHHESEEPTVSDHYRGPLRADLSSRYHVFEIPQRLPEGGDVYIRISSERSALAPELLTRDALYGRDHWLYGADVALRTILLVMALVGLLIWMVLRERVYLKYAGYVFAILLAFSAHDGSLYSVPVLKWYGELGYSGIWALVCVSVILLIVFSREFLRTKTHAPRIDFALSIAQWLFAASAIYGVFLFDIGSSVLIRLTGLAYLATVVLLLASAVINARRGKSQGWIFLVGFTPHGIAMLIQAAVMISALTTVEWLYTGFLASMAFESLVFALGLASRALLYRRERDAALELADKDDLTQTYNRRAIDRKLDGLCAMVRDEDLATISVLFIDLDHFKRINDAYGHAAGDECLRQVARLIRAELRAGDLLGRYGGEEFVVVLPGSDPDDALGIAERIRKRASSATLIIGGHQIHIHLSIGVAATNGSSANARRILDSADKAMYRSKAEGRNRVTLID
jgi:diguanylate cyclase (GGDEF)-like protein